MPINPTPRRILLDLATTLDGFIEGKNGEVDWCIMEPDMGFIGFLEGIDTILYGRKSYELWGRYLPSEDAPENEKELWGQVHSKQKIVFSKTWQDPDNQTRIVRENIAEEMRRLKALPGKDLWLYGGASLITEFINLGLVDEFRLSVHPVILGEGKPLFMDIRQRQNLKLVDARAFSSGVVQLIYHRENGR